MPRSRLRMMFADGRIDAATLVWREGLADWIALGEATELLGDDAS